jgi:biofilm PGA synthesis N-glycosyltransferase PgaC
MAAMSLRVRNPVARTLTRASDPRPIAPVTVIVPAYNEAEHVADTIRSLLEQDVRPARVLVVDDCSTDSTAEVARAAGAEVVRPERNTGSKAGAQTFALAFVDTPFVAAVDADTTLEAGAIGSLMATIQADWDVAAACSFVLPRRVKSMWERGRYAEYLYAFTFFKPIQDAFGKPLISSGCCSVYRTDALRRVGGWNDRTLAEDVDLTWSLYQAGWKVRFVPEAMCYPVEPHDAKFMAKQLRRWSHGFVQNIRLHWRNVLHLPYLRSVLAVAMWDAVLAPLFYLIGLPLLAIFVSPVFLLGYVIDAPIVAIPVMYQGIRRREPLKALVGIPCFFVLRFVNGLFMLKALWLEVVRRRPLLVYEKGHA